MAWPVAALVVACLLLQHVDCKPRARIVRPRRELLPPEQGPTHEMIFDSGLLEKTLSAATLYEKAQQYYAEVSIKRFQGHVLGYVTPWHRRGYEMASLFRAKLTHLSPVWYQLKRKDQEWLLEGGHEYNGTWIDEVRAPAGEAGTVTQVVPRVIVELGSAQDHVAMVSSEAAHVVDLLAREIVDRDYDGMVLEVWMTWAHMNAMANDEFAAAALSFTRALHTTLHASKGRPRLLILAVPPAIPQSYGRPFTEKKHLQQFSPWVDFWSLMTYDYAMGTGAQPNSPLPWLESQTKLLLDPKDGGAACAPEQALMGINFYGYDYSLRDQVQPEAITSDGLMQLLKQQPSLEWHEEEGEHSFEYQAPTGRRQVYYPTPRSLELRLQMFRKLGLGVSIWELGQGYFGAPHTQLLRTKHVSPLSGQLQAAYLELVHWVSSDIMKKAEQMICSSQ